MMNWMKTLAKLAKIAKKRPRAPIRNQESGMGNGEREPQKAQKTQKIIFEIYTYF